MAKINNTNIYNYKELPSLIDYIIGTSFDESKKTKNFRINSLIQLINGVNGVNNIQFLFSDGSNPDIDYNHEGVFFSNTNDGNPANFTQLILNKQAIQPIDLSGLFNFLDTIKNVVIKFENPSEPNTAFKFKVLNITEEEDHFIFDVSIFEGFSFGEFLNENIYSFYFDVVQDQNSIDTILKYGVITNEGGFATIQENQFAWRLNQIDFLTSPFYSHVINPATDGFYRTDIIVVNDTGNYQYVPGTENATEALEPPTPLGTLKAGVIQVYGDIISDPVVPVDLSGYVIKEEFDLLVERVTDLELPDAVLKTGTITIDDLNIDIEANEFAWRLNHVNYLTTPVFNVNISPTSPDYIRYDLLVGLPNADYGIKEGIEGENTADVPAPDSGTIQLAILVIQNNVIIDIIPSPVVDLTSIENRLTVLENSVYSKTGFTDKAIFTWSGTGLTFNYIFPSYYIDDVLRPAISGQITLTVPVVTQNRIVTIFVDYNGINYVLGEPSADPVSPTINNTTQLFVTNILILANTSVPANMSQNIVYSENNPALEWNHTTNDPGVIFNSTDSYDGTVAIAITNSINQRSIVFDNDVDIRVVEITGLSFWFKPVGNVPSNRGFNIEFLLNGNVVSEYVSIVRSNRPSETNDGAYNIKWNQNIYQYVFIPIADFRFRNNISSFDTIRFSFVNSGLNARIDYMNLVSGGGTISSPDKKGFSSIITDNGNVVALTSEDTFEMKGDGGTTVTSEGKNILIDTGTLSTRIQTLENSTVRSAQNYYKDIDLDGEITDLDISTTPMTSLNFIGSVTILKSLFYPPLFSQPLDGVSFFIKNSQAIPITIEHEALSELAGRYLFSFYDDEDLIIEPNQIIEFKNKSQTDKGKIELVGYSGPAILKEANDYADSLVIGLLDDKGNYNPSINSNLYPYVGGTSSQGTITTILTGQLWAIYGLGEGVEVLIGTKIVTDGDVVRSLVDNPTNNDIDWVITENNFGYIPENKANKSTNVEADKASNTKYSSILAFVTWLKDSFVSNLTAKVTAFVDADRFIFGDSEDIFKTKTRTYLQLLTQLKTYFDGQYGLGQITITTSTNITTDTLDASSNSQFGRHVIINNGSSNITITVNGVGTKPTTYQKEGTGTITFVAGSGRTLRTPDGSAIMNGVVGSTCALSSFGTIDNLRISNAI